MNDKIREYALSQADPMAGLSGFEMVLNIFLK